MGNMLSGLLIPFGGTILGSAFVFFMKKQIHPLVQRALTGFAGGVMVAASIWSLLIPAMEQSASWGKVAFVPAAGGFLLGILFLLLLDENIPHQHLNAETAEGRPSPRLGKVGMLLLAVTLHNIPEGMAVGVVYAGHMLNSGISETGALALALGIALQNVPEGAIISMPLRSAGMSRFKAFLCGTASGAVEPIGTLLMLWLARQMVPVLPWFLGFAAGAMIYVVVEELIPEMSEEPHSNIGTILFAIGFVLMMALDVALG